MKQKNTNKNHTAIAAILLCVAAFSAPAYADIFSPRTLFINATQGILFSNGILTSLFANTTTGFIGIGTTSPTDRLTIAGNISFVNGPKIMDDAGRLKFQAGGTASGSTGNGSIFFLNSTGGAVGRFDTADIVNATAGTGLDGSVTISTNVNCYTTQACIAYSVNQNSTSGQTTLFMEDTTGLFIGDELLIIQMTGPTAGNYEFKRITFKQSTNVTLDGNLANTYFYNSTAKAQAVRVPQYATLIITGNLTTIPWNGTIGGVLPLRATTMINITSIGTINMTGKGFTGGAGGAGGSAGGGTITTVPGTGGPGGNGSAGSGPGGSGAGFAGGSAGSPGTLQGGDQTGSGGTGGSGGVGSSGSGGSYGGLGINGTSTSAAGGSGRSTTSQTGGSGGGGAAVSPNPAGSTYGNADLSTMFLGSGGGGGGGGRGGTGGYGNGGVSTTGGNGGAGGAGGAGGSGGGIIFIETARLVNSGHILAMGNFSSTPSSGSDGSQGQAFVCGDPPNCGIIGGTAGGGGGAGGNAGGSGSGGSIFVKASNITVFGSATINATGGRAVPSGNGGAGGAGGTSNSGSQGGGGGGGAGFSGGSVGAGGTAGGSAGTSTGASGGAGGDGRIRCETPAGSGCTTTPAANQAAYSGGSYGNFYGSFYLGRTVTNAADLAEYYVTGDDSIEAGDVVSISNVRIFDNKEEITSRGVLRKSRLNDNKLVGVISTSPGLLLGSMHEDGRKDFRMLALAGRVPVKVNNENGPIEIGDLLTSSSTPGVAMRARGPSYVIGRSLEDFSGENGKILMMIRPGEGDILDTIKAQQEMLEKIEAQCSEALNLLNSMERK